MNPHLLRMAGASFLVLNVFAVSTLKAGTGGLFFDGLNDYVTFGAATNINNLGVTNFTVECWFKRQGPGKRSSTGNGGINAIPLVTRGMGEADGSNLDCNWFFGIGTNNVGEAVLAADFEDRNTGLNHPIRGETLIASNTWLHGAVTYSVAGSNWVLYLNGAVYATTNITGPSGITNFNMLIPRYDSIQHAALGTSLRSNGNTNNPDSGFFAGTMDEVRVWNVARSADEIASNYNLTISSGPGLIARWALDETSGTTAANSIAGGVNGRLTNFVALPWTNGYLPTVTISGPANGSTAIGDWVSIAATVLAGDRGIVTNVEFYANTLKIGEDATAPYTLTLCDATPATYSLTAVALDNAGYRATSSVVSVTVSAPLATGSLEFDGANDYVTFGPAPQLGVTNFTVECWFKRTGAGATTTTGSGGVTAAVPLVTKGRGEADGDNRDMNWFMGFTSAGVLIADFEDRNAGTNHPVTGTTAAGSNVWQHAAVTYQQDDTNGTWVVYLNGLPDKTNTFSGTNALVTTPRGDSIQHAAIGSALTSVGVAAGFFAGAMDEVRIWNYARSADQILTNYNLQITNQAGLIARWSLNEGSGAGIRSAICGGVNGNLTNGPVWSTDYFDANSPPSVSITNPVDDAVILGAIVTIEATASDADGSVTNVQFFSGITLLGDDATEPYSFVWTGVTPGAYALTAVASDDLGLSVTSAVVNVTVVPIVPSVSITNPVNNDVISATNVTIEATASDADGSVTDVQFYSGNTLLGDDTTEPYSFVWNGVGPGAYALKAVATDDLGYSTTSAVVNVTVTPPPGVGGLYFDGKNDYVTMGVAPDLGVSNLTIECWFKVQGTGKRANTGAGGIFAVPLVTKGMAEIELTITNMNFFFGIGTNNSGQPVLAADFEDMNNGLNHPIRGETPIASNTWQHAAVTYSVASSNWVLYLNGAIYATTNITGPSGITNFDMLVPRFDSIQHAALGSSLHTAGTTNADTGFFGGTMDEVRIWNVVRTDTEITNNYQAQITSAPGLIARWSLDDAAGLTATNSGSSGVEGTLTNGPVWVDGYPFVLGPAIGDQPQSQSVQCGDNATFTVTATGAPPLDYQWYFGTGPLSGETNVTLQLIGVDESRAGSYTVIVTNVSGSVTSAPAVLTVTDTNAPVITSQPQSATNVVGTTAAFGVTATSCSSVNYQWLFDMNPLSGETNQTLIITNVQPGDAGDYSVLLASIGGSTTSAVAVLTIELPIRATVSVAPKILANGHFYVGFTGTTNVAYTIEYADVIVGPWQTLTNMTTGASGFIEVEDFTTPRPSMRFYRAVYP